MENYKILSVADEQLNDCAATIRSAFGVTAKEFGFTKENYPSSGAFITAETLRGVKSKGVHMYAAWVKGKPVGYVQLEKKEKGVYSFQKFAVLPDYQQFGIGRALISFCKNKAQVYGGKKLVLIMVDKNQRLKDFYLSEGFYITGTRLDKDHPFLQSIMEMDL